jgi:alpha-mannosidase
MHIRSTRWSFKNRLVSLSPLLTSICVLLLAQVSGSAQVKELYVFTATHFDLTFTGPPPFSFARNHRIFDSALNLADEQPNFRYAIENLYLLQQYLDTHPEKQAAVMAAIRAKKFELAAQWSDMQQNLVTGEDLARNILVATEFARRKFDFLPQIQTLSDIPGQTPQAPQILSRAGLKGLIITRAGPTDAHLFNWKGLDGSSIRVASLSYVDGHFLGSS